MVRPEGLAYVWGLIGRKIKVPCPGQSKGNGAFIKHLLHV